MPTTRTTRAGKALKTILIAFSVVIVVLVAAVYFAVPPIAAGFIAGTHPVNLPSGPGAANIKDVSITWGGPQKIGKIVLTDANGATIADLRAQASVSILGALLGDGNLGTVAIAGDITVTEDQLATTPSAAPPPAAPAPSAPPAAPAASAPLQIPRSLRATLEAKPINITYTPRAGSGMNPVRVDQLEAVITLLGSGEAAAVITAKAPTIDIKASARNFVDPAGRLVLSTTEGEVNATIAAPGEFVEAVARLALKQPPSPASTSAGAATTDIAAHVKVERGRLRLADPAKPITAKGPIPQAMIEMLAGTDATVHIDASPSITKIIGPLDLPLPDASGKVDLRGGSLRAVMTSTPIVGTVALEGAAPRPFRVEPMEWIVDSPDFAQALTIKGRARGSFDGHDAGALELDAEAQGLLDDKGMVRAGIPGKLRADLRLKGVPTRLADSLVRDQGFSLAEVIGPSLDAELLVRTIESAGAALPPAEVTLKAAASHLTAALAASIDDKELRFIGEGLSVQATRLAPAIRAFAKDQAIELTGDARAVITARELTVPLISPGLPDLARLATSITLNLSDIVIEKGAGDRPLALQNLETRLALAADNPPALTLKYNLASGGRPFGAAGDANLPGLLTKRDQGWPFIDLTPQTMRPAGTLEIKGLPSDILGYLPDELRPAAAELLGPGADIRLEGKRDDTGKTAITLALTGANINATSALTMDDKSIATGESKVETTLTPALIDALTSVYTADMSPRPGLAQPARLSATVFPATLSLDAGKKPDLQTMTPVRAMLTSADDIVLNDIPSGQAAPISAGLRGLEVGLVWNHRDIRKREASIKASLFDPTDPAAAVAALDLAAIIANPPPTFDAKIDNIDTTRMDRLLARPGLLADILGEAAGLQARGQARAGVQDVELIIKSPRVDSVLALRRTDELIALTSPGSVNLDIPAAWANRYLFPPGPDAAAPSVQLTDAVKLALRLDKLAIAPGDAPMKPGVFALDASASAPTIKLRTADGQQVDVQALSAKLANNETKRGVSFDISTRQIAVAGASSANGPAAAATPVRAAGDVANLADPSGKPDPANAAVTANITGTLPTALIDALASQQGLLIDLLGGTTNVELTATNFSKTAGALSASMTADNAKATVKGAVRNATFITEGPTNITIRRITPELSKRYIETAIPIISRVEKTPQDEPAVLIGNAITVPTDGDTHKLNGRASVDLGTIQFESSSFFGKLLKAAGGKDRGSVGKRIKPFEFVADQGVVSYDRIELPLGEFTIETRGKVDLNKKKMDIITYVPFSALASEITGQLANIPGLDALTMIPIRTHGSFDNPKTDVQLDLIVREAVPGAIEKALPDDIKKVIPPEIGEGLKDLFKKKEKKD